MRLPNGTGQIIKLSGKRRNPYAVYPPTKKRDPKTGRYVRDKAIGYYPTKKAAMEALFDWHKNPYVSNRATLQEIFDLWMEDKKKDNISAATISTYQNLATKTILPLGHCIYSDLRIVDFQNILDDCKLSWNSQMIIKSMLKMMGKFALKNDFVAKDYASFIKVRKENDGIKGIPFTENEIALLWHNLGVLDGVEITLILIYTGMRIGELKKAQIDLENNLFCGGVKTDAGKNRIIPIHPKIRKFVEDFDQKAFREATWRNKVFNTLMDSLNIRYVGDVPHTPHDCRHTFSWLADKYKIDKLSKHLLMGHSPKGVEDAVYGHRTVEELRAEIEKIKI